MLLSARVDVLLSALVDQLLAPRVDALLAARVDSLLSVLMDPLLAPRVDALLAAQVDALLAPHVDALLSVLHLRLNTDSCTVVFSHLTIYDVQHIKFMFLSLPSLTCVGGFEKADFPEGSAPQQHAISNKTQVQP